MPSRRKLSPEDFVSDFLGSLSESVIPAERVIDWDEVEAAVLLAQSHEVSDLAKRLKVGECPEEAIARALRESNRPDELLGRLLFLMGFPGGELGVLGHGVISASELKGLRGEKRARACKEAGVVLAEVGLPRVLRGFDPAQVAAGVRIGLDTHRRKNRGGEAFREIVGGELNGVAAELRKRSGSDWQLKEEASICYGDNLSKRVDFALTKNGRIRYGIEANYYTSSGSKPTEIKRSYGDVRRGLAEVGVELIWVTDGRGYQRMRNSLRDAFVIMPNIYNLNQLQRFLINDILAEEAAR